MDDAVSSNDELSKYDIYGKTPPRTKISRKVRDKKQKQFGSESTSKHKSKHNMPRRITTMHDELFTNAEPSATDTAFSKRTNKRQLKILRDSERDLKLDIPRAQFHGQKGGHHSRSRERTPTTPSYHIEIDKKFMCLLGRSVPCQRQKHHHQAHGDVTDHKPAIDKSHASEEDDETLKSRTEFYQTLSLLIRMGGKRDHPRRGISREESLWQTELKDLIWLELQAFHSNRSAMEEDQYLCQERESVEGLLSSIMTYRFSRNARKMSTSLISTDSGVEDDCPGCLSVRCISCIEAQNEALRDVEAIMKRLEDAEDLFPSSKAFAELYPLYSSPEFNSRVKAIGLWYNMTKMQRLKLGTLGKLILCLESRQSWPVICESSGTSSDSNTSVDSQDDCPCNNIYSVIPIVQMISKREKDSISPYRRYIENMLKTRTLHKSLRFLDDMHQFVLEKVELTLEKPTDDDLFSKDVSDPTEELQRYGFWSPEAKNLDLPSYRALFLFLSRVPLDFIQEYLQMRLEQKPENPSPLSVRQLLRELKEGLKVGVMEREKLERYMAAVKCSNESVHLDCESQLENFDECMSKVFKDYLEYLREWALLNQNNLQKNLLEEEYYFSLSVIKYIPNGFDLLTKRYVDILATIFQRIADRLTLRIEELLEDISTEDDNCLKQTLFSTCREFQSLFNEEREMSMKTMAFCKKIAGSLDKLKMSNEERSLYQKLGGSITALKCVIPHGIAKVQNLFELINTDELEEVDKAGLSSRIREILMQIYRFGFEFYKEMSDSQYRQKLVLSMVKFSKLWMKFVTERCERGRGTRPRWATQGMEFLLTVCEPANTRFLSNEEFEDLKRSMDECISHLIGNATPTTPDSGFSSSGSPKISLEHLKKSRSRGSSPIPRGNFKSSQRSGSQAMTRIASIERITSSPKLDQDELVFQNSLKKDEKKLSIVSINLPPSTYSERIKDAVEALDKRLDEKHSKQQLIGKVIEFNCEKKANMRRNVTFSWQRGIKIGQGRFGKVYTAVNNNTGEMMAVKEMQLQPNDQVTVKTVLGEMKILEGCNHENLVKYYGLEVYTDKLLIFMEYCAEGTLENLILATENGLPELLVRKYTYQLLSGVAALHYNGIVHRDIKPANIFLTDEGNCLKIGDFGCAAKIKAHTTMAGELQGLVGTQAYMAPEVFTKTITDGHGRAADIWSVGCVVIEMASGKRPWFQYDSSYQIMFKVGMGQSPEPPENMQYEGLDCLKLCFKHDPKERATAHELFEHPYVKVGRDLN